MKKLFLTLTLIVALTGWAAAQNHQLSGKVTDVQGMPITGASVVVEGTMTGATTGLDGEFTLNVPQEGKIVVSFIGYNSQTVDFTGKTNLDIVLTEETQKIDDVIVVAFGTAKKEAFTGSAGVVKSDDIGKVQSSNIAKALTGKVAGVQMTTSSGQPGSGVDIRIRGFGSLNAGNGPLWIVDGMPYSGDLNNLNANDIEAAKEIIAGTARSMGVRIEGREMKKKYPVTRKLAALLKGENIEE